MLLVLAVAGAARAEPVRIVGGPGGGCIAGAVELPAAGPGFVTIRTSRSSFWGAPTVIGALQVLGQQAQAAGLGALYMNDVSKRHGGPFPGVHLSHMMGLDADVWLDVRPKPALDAAGRDRVEVESLVEPGGRGVVPGLWSQGHVTLMRLAAALPGVDRVLVNPAIKRQLCETVRGDRTWLARIRPWYGHAAHMHVHFRCPAGQAECRDQAPAPAGEACDASLQWWFDELDKPPAPAVGGPPRKVVLPAACTAIMAGR